MKVLGSGSAARPLGDADVACRESEGSALKRTADNFINQERDSDPQYLHLSGGAA